MKLSEFFKSIIDADEAPIVICDTEHTIIYMNPSAIVRYHKYGGNALLGKSLLDCHNPDSNNTIKNILKWFAEDVSHNKVFTAHKKKDNSDIYMTVLRDESGKLIGYYEKHESRTLENKENLCSL